MEILIVIGILFAAAWIYSAGHKSGKREGSRKGYGVGYSRGRRSKSQSGCAIVPAIFAALTTSAAVAACLQ